MFLVCQAYAKYSNEWTWIDTPIIAAIDFRVNALILGDSKYILCGGIYTSRYR